MTPSTRVPSRRPHAVALRVTCAVIVVVAFAVGCSGPTLPEPPTVAVSSLDPALGDLIQRSRAAVVTTPGSADAWGRLGQALHVAEFLREAQTCYRQAMAQDPTSARWVHLSSLLQLQEQPEEAIRGLARAADLAGSQTDAPRVRLVQALVERGRYDEAGSSIRSLLARDPLHVAARLELARIHLARNETDPAADALQPCLTNAHTMRPATLLLAQVRQRQGDTIAANELSSRAARMPRPFDWPDPYFREVQSLRADRQRVTDQINALLMQQRLREAEVALAPLLQSRPNDPEVMLMFGRLRFLERKCQEAEAIFRQHLAVQPDSLNGLMQLALAILCQQRWADAVTTLRQVVALKPDFTQAHYNIGYALARSGDSAGAVASYREALRTSPGDMNSRLALAEELYLAGQREAGLAELDRASESNPADPRAGQLRQRLLQQR